MDGKGTGLSPHPGTQRLIAYRQGTLPAAERDGVQEHLSLCPRCVGLLRELRDFEAAVESGAQAPEPLREEAWADLRRRLPEKPPAIRPVAQLPRSRAPYFVRAAGLSAIAALLLAVAGLGLLVRTERQRSAGLERRLAGQEEALSGLQRSLSDAGRRLDAERGRFRSLQTETTGQVAALSAEVEKLRRNPPAPERDRLASADNSDIRISMSPRFVLRGAEPSGGDVLKGGGETNRVKARDGSFTVGLAVPDDLPFFFPEVRLEILDRNGRVVWSGRRPGEALGDDGASVTVQGLRPGRYRLRVEGLQPNRTRFLGEYALDVGE